MPSDAGALFEAFVEGVSPDREPDIDAFCREHPEHEAELRRRYDEWRAVLDRLREGAVSLDALGPGESSGATGGLVERLRRRLGEESRYEILGEFARGGMGVVLRVWDRDLRRTLAMKVVLGRDGSASTGTTPQLDERTLARFLEEAQVTGQLDHPGIVPVHELGLDNTGRVFFTMKLVKGEDLRTVIERAHDPQDDGWNMTRVLSALLRVCEAMAYAHDKKVIHRDLKPANIMVGRYGEVYVMDWGLARVLGEEDRRDLRLQPASEASISVVRTDRREESSSDTPLATMDGDVVGTPAYMSPEQARGDLAAMGPAADVYAIGAILYHLLSGQMPYLSPGSRSSSQELLEMVKAGPPADLAGIVRDVPGELIAICNKAMRREATQRYPDTRELADDLRAFLENRVVAAYRSGPVAQLRKWVARNQGQALTAGVAVLLLAVILLWSFRSIQLEKTTALAERDRATLNAAKLGRLSDVKALMDLRSEMNALWPAHPQQIGPMEDWLARARHLQAQIPAHERTLADLRRRGTPREHPRQAELDELQRQGARLSEELDAAEETDSLDRRRDRLEALRDLLEERASLAVTIHREQPHRFEDRTLAWWHETLMGLIGDLSALSDPDPFGVTLSNVEQRLEFARSIERRSIEDHRDDWDRAIASISDPGECPQYSGLVLREQIGLVPIGRDSGSGLWEFWHLQTGSRPARDDAGRITPSNGMGLVLVLIPGGTTWIGAQRRDPSGRNHDPQALQDEWRDGRAIQVTLEPYFLSKFEMTQGQWSRFTGANPSFYLPGGKFGDSITTLRHPVDSVSWDDCARVLGRLGLVLPTEAQWEHGCRAGTESPWWIGDDASALHEAGNLADRLSGKAPVGRYRANAFGLHDVIGNVSEWCLDEYGALGRASGSSIRVARGGSFNSQPAHARSAFRLNLTRGRRNDILGCRPARPIN